MDMLVALALISSICAGTIGGVFFAFSTFVMRALAAVPPAQRIAAMQRINVTASALARVLGEAWPGDAPREMVIAQAFRARRVDESYRARLRV